jgi:hypothetical protein
MPAIALLKIRFDFTARKIRRLSNFSVDLPMGKKGFGADFDRTTQLDRPQNSSIILTSSPTTYL